MHGSSARGRNSLSLSQKQESQVGSAKPEGSMAYLNNNRRISWACILSLGQRSSGLD
jgi:hypothetical protein